MPAKKGDKGKKAPAKVPAKAAAKVPREAPRIGVFVCHCGKNIGGFVDVPKIVEEIKKLPNVVYAMGNLYTCSQDGLDTIKDNIKAHKLNRVIVASCTPRTHAPLFQSACEQAGVNKYLFEFVNIRDQCSWVHMNQKEMGTQKALDLIKMGVARAALLEPMTDSTTVVIPVALVLGGGIAGMTAALNLAAQKMEVHLIEKEGELGGKLRQLDTVYPDDVPAKQLIDPLIKKVKDSKNIKLYLNNEPVDINGYIGNFQVTLKDGKKFKAGTIIVATGASNLVPSGMFGYGKYDNVVTAVDFEAMLKKGTVPKKVAFIQCVGARTMDPSGRTYCSKTCCLAALKNAKKIKAKGSGYEAYVIHRDINAPGSYYEKYYHNVKGTGVRFLRYTLDDQPEIIGSGSKATAVKLNHETSGRNYEIPVDLVVLSTPMVSNPDNVKLNKMLKVPLDKDGFFLEAHVKLRPLDFATEGIFLAGTAKFPNDIRETVTEAYGAASHASIPMSQGKVRTDAITAWVDPDKCSGCGICESVCPYRAITMVCDGDVRVADVNPALCKGCGTCSPQCPTKAITAKGFTDQQLVAQVIEAADSTIPENEPKIVGFCCNWCSYAGADMAGVSRFQYPANMRIIRTMCSGRVDPMWILRAFLEGADGVFVSGCHPGDCHYMTGNNYTKERMEQLKQMLSEAGIEPRRLRLEWISASEGNRFAELVTEFTKEIKALGPSPIRQTRERRRASVKET
jgi:heterodisulfide reductase subunit A